MIRIPCVLGVGLYKGNFSIKEETNIEECTNSREGILIKTSRDSYNELDNTSLVFSDILLGII